MTHPTDDAAATEPRLTRAERADLQRVVRLRAKVNRDNLEAEKARRLADFKAEIASRYRSDDAAWADLTETAQRAVAAADEDLKRRCDELGIRPEFRPSISIGWHGRGENGSASRRVELLGVASSEIDAQIKAAKVAISSAEADLITEILADGLRSEHASQWLERIPTPEELILRLDPLSIEAKATQQHRRRGIGW